MTTLSSSFVRGELFNVRRSGPAYRTTTKRMTPSQAAGIRFEKKKVQPRLDVLAKSLGAKVEHNPWFQYNDENGPHACSPDSIFIFEDSVIVIEIKVTWIPVAISKLRNLYLPVVSRILRPERLGGIVLCKNLTPETPAPTLTQNLSSAIKMPFIIPTLHWPLETAILY